MTNEKMTANRAGGTAIALWAATATTELAALATWAMSAETGPGSETLIHGLAGIGLAMLALAIAWTLKHDECFQAERRRWGNRTSSARNGGPGFIRQAPRPRRG